MERLTEIDPCWLGEECWTKARRVGADMIDAVYKRLWEYENIGSTPDGIVKTLWNAVPIVRCEDCVFFAANTNQNKELTGYDGVCMKTVREGGIIDFCDLSDYCSRAKRKEHP